MEEQEPLVASQDTNTQTHRNVHCRLFSIISVASFMHTRAINNYMYYMSDYENHLFIYLPGFHAVKTKHDIEALAHSTNTVQLTSSLYLLAHRCFNDRLKVVKKFNWL